MFIILIPVVVIVCAIIFAVWVSMRTERRVKNRHDWTFQFIQVARRLVEHLPQHRGMANAFLKGDASFQEKILALQKMIEEDFVELKRIAAHPISAFEDSVLQVIQKDWVHIKDHVFTFDAEKSFAIHSLLISKFLDQIEDTCELTSLYESSPNKLLIKALASDLPQLTESLGQARGLGAGVAAQASCSLSEQLKLKFLVTKCDKIFEETLGPLLNSSGSTLTSQEGLFRTCLEKGRGFVATVRNELIDVQEIHIEPAQYYADATQAIEESFRLFDSLLLEVKK